MTISNKKKDYLQVNIESHLSKISEYFYLKIFKYFSFIGTVGVMIGVKTDTLEC